MNGQPAGTLTRVGRQTRPPQRLGEAVPQQDENKEDNRDDVREEIKEDEREETRAKKSENKREETREDKREEKLGKQIEEMIEEKMEDQMQEMIETKIEDEIQKKIGTMIEEKMEQIIEGKIKKKLEKTIEGKIEEMLGDMLEEEIEKKIEEKIRQMMEGKIKEKIKEEIEEQGKEMIEVKINEMIEERIEEKIEEKMDEKIEEKRDEWKTARGRVQQHIQKENNTQIQTSNRFSVLDPDVELEKEKEDIRYLIVGDSRVRPLGNVCGEKDKCVVRPGATVAEMGPVIQEQLDKCDPKVVVVHVGVNDVGPRRSVKLENDFCALLRRLEEARKPTIVTGILPRATASNEWYSRAIAANASVKQLCLKMGLEFVDLWQDFYGSKRFYLRDGLHLSDEGARALWDAYRNAIQEN